MASKFHTKELYCAEVNTESYQFSRRKLDISFIVLQYALNFVGSLLRLILNCGVLIVRNRKCFDRSIIYKGVEYNCLLPLQSQAVSFP